MDNNTPYGYNVDGEYTGSGNPYYNLSDSEDDTDTEDS